MKLAMTVSQPEPEMREQGKNQGVRQRLPENLICA
jgi:hypothetical protein